MISFWYRFSNCFSSTICKAWIRADVYLTHTSWILTQRDQREEKIESVSHPIWCSLYSNTLSSLRKFQCVMCLFHVAWRRSKRTYQLYIHCVIFRLFKYIYIYKGSERVPRMRTRSFVRIITYRDFCITPQRRLKKPCKFRIAIRNMHWSALT